MFFQLSFGLQFRKAGSVNISAADPHWQSLVDAAFKYRIAFDLTDLDKPKLAEAEIHKLIVAWSVRRTYTPTFTGDTNIRFVPDELVGHEKAPAK